MTLRLWIIAVLLSFSSCQEQRVAAPLNDYLDHVLRESLFRTLSPPGNVDLYRRILNAKVYPGPGAASRNETFGLTGGGDLFHLPNGHWILCHEGCSSCEPCRSQLPVLKWTSRLLRRSSSDGPRLDLLLTVKPQIDGSYHLDSLSSTSFVYLMTQGQRDRFYEERVHAGNVLNGFSNFDGFSSARNSNRIDEVRRNEGTNETRMDPEKSLDAKDQPTSPKVEDDQRSKNLRRPGLRLIQSGPKNSSRGLEFSKNLPKLILGRDPQGQRHLVHFVPADQPNIRGQDPNLAGQDQNLAGQDPNLVNNGNERVQGRPYQKLAASPYQRVFRRIFDSLNAHRKTIEDFLDPSVSRSRRNQKSVVDSGNLDPKIGEQDQILKAKIGQGGILSGHIGQGRIMRDKIVQDEILRDKIGQDRILADKIHQDRILKDKIEQDRILRGKVEQDRVLREKIDQYRILREKTGQDRILNDEIGQDRILKDKIGQDQTLREKIGLDRVLKVKTEHSANMTV